MRQTVWIVLGITAAALVFLYWPTRGGRTLAQDSATPGTAPSSAIVPGPAANAGHSGPGPTDAEAALFAQGWGEVIAEATTKQIPPTEQLNVYAQVLRSVSHENYRRLAAPLLVSGTGDSVALQALWHDLRARPPVLSLPVMAEIATEPDHPLALAAAQMLKLALRENYPDDPGKLRQAVEQFSAVR